MLSWTVWLKFLLSKVIGTTCLLIFTRFTKQSASWKVLEICEFYALSTDLQKTYSVNTLVALATASTGGGGGGVNGEDPRKSSYELRGLRNLKLESWMASIEGFYHDANAGAPKSIKNLVTSRTVKSGI